MTFDIVEFYPSLSPALLNAALDFAQQYVRISPKERDIIQHANNSILISEGESWDKSKTRTLFDVTMVSFDGAETCELVGSFLLSAITSKFRDKFGLYRDDGLGMVQTTPRRAEQMKKELCALFRQHDLRITIEANLKNINYLDVNLDICTGKTTPYIKPNNPPTYVHSKSNHPSQIIKKHTDLH